MVRQGPVGEEIYFEFRKRKSNIRVLTMTIKSKPINFFSTWVQVFFCCFSSLISYGERVKLEYFHPYPFLRYHRKKIV